MADGLWARFGVLALVILSLLGWSSRAAAQPSSLPPNVIAPSGENTVIRNQLTLARKLEQQALQGMQALPGDNSIPIDPAALQAARDAYVLIRAALHGMGWQKEAKKFPDPVFDLAFKRVNDAWNLSRYPVDRASWGMERADYARESAQRMSQAIRLLDQALVMMP
jgi:hypothetical protein